MPLELKNKQDFQKKRSIYKKISHNPAAAAAAKLLQLCPTLFDPIDGSPPGSSIIILHSSNEQHKHEENFIYNSIKKITRFNIRNTKLIFQKLQGCWRKFKKTSIKGKTFHTHRSEDIIQLRRQYFIQIEQTQYSLFQNPSWLLCTNWQLILKCIQKFKGHRIPKTILNKVERLTRGHFKTYYTQLQ